MFCLQLTSTTREASRRCLAFGSSAAPTRRPRLGSPRVRQPRFIHVTASQQTNEDNGTSGSDSKGTSFASKRGITRGQVILLTLGGSVFPFILFQVLERLPGQDAISAGRWTVAAITIATVAWVMTYLVRVGTKNTTYARQLRAYEDAVLQRRLDELSEEELQALLAEEDEKAQGTMPNQRNSSS
ncbi:hypothetical protein CCYA_CCYA05G1543 [Cyanidiococcus yangmingshanensis]|nr:hypothetical protein CCYA_CCYA05G1543 [Cyanidiococcus yangmingshanensis]